MSTSFFDDTPVGRFINNVSSGRLLPKPDEVSGFILPDSLTKCLNTIHRDSTPGSELTATESRTTEKPEEGMMTASPILTEKETEKEQVEKKEQHDSTPVSTDLEQNHLTEDQELTRVLTRIFSNSETMTRGESRSRAPPIPYVQCDKDTIIVDWYGDNDPEKPTNWNRSRKVITTLCICFLTFSVYAGSSIITPSIPGLMQEFNIGPTKGVLTLSVFIMGYAVGPLLLAPPSDIPSIGRSTPYWTSMGALVLFNVGAAHAPNYGTLITMRLLSGIAGSPALATGGATLGDVWEGLALPKAIAIWALGAVCGPVLAPVIAGWCAQNISWRLPLYLFVALAGLGFLTVLFILPETLHANILFRRAQRLRKLTGNNRLKSQGEVNQSKLSYSHFIIQGFYMPIRISLEPIVLYSSVLLGLVYAIFYCAFESVPLIYGGIYHWNIGEQTLPFLALGVFGLIGLAAYLCYLIYWFDPRFIHKAQKGIIDPEDRIILAILSSPLVLISLFWTGWSARAGVSFWSPLIAQGIYVIPTYYLFQSVLTYLAFAYPEHQASVFAANDLIRSLIASAFPIFARPLFVNLGLGKGYSLLAGLSLALMLPLWGLFRYGYILRKHSKFAHDYSTPPQM